MQSRPAVGGFYHSSDMSRSIRVVASLTQLSRADEGCIAVSGSHGGSSAARFAIVARPLVTVLNDAGGGKDGAGFAGLALLQAEGLAACTVSHTSARIGEARSTLEDGIISRTNAAAAGLGLAAGQRCKEQAERLARMPQGDPT